MGCTFFLVSQIFEEFSFLEILEGGSSLVAHFFQFYKYLNIFNLQRSLKEDHGLHNFFVLQIFEEFLFLQISERGSWVAQAPALTRCR